MLKIKQLEGNGDFRSDECIEYLKQADVVVTNPPFSLFREYVAQLMEYGKKFIIIGNKNAIIDKDIFPYIKNNQLWLGATMTTGGRFYIPEHYGETTSVAARVDDKGRNTVVICGACWFSNVETKRRFETLDLYKHYSEKEFPKYDNYDAIEVSKSCDIPMDYDGIMGVPITFLFKFCPNQFEILAVTSSSEENTFGLLKGNGTTKASINGKCIYSRLLIKKVSA